MEKARVLTGVARQRPPNKTDEEVALDVLPMLRMDAAAMIDYEKQMARQ